VTRLRVLIGVVLALSLETTPAGSSQATPLPCSPAAMGRPAFSASDLDELGASRLVATHTVQVTTDFGATLVDDGTVKLSVPASATVIRPHGDINAGPGGLIFVGHTAGSVPVTASWTQDDGSGGTCRGSASTTIRLQRATRMPRLVNVRAAEHLHPNLRWDLLWRFGATLGRSTDLDPVVLMARGVGHPRLPRATQRFTKVTVPLRLGDPGFREAREYHIGLPRWMVTTGGDHHAFYVDGDARGIPSPVDVALGYEVKVLQSGRLLARLRLAGHCNSTICNMRTIKVQLS
jgi:hypothetical protein